MTTLTWRPYRRDDLAGMADLVNERVAAEGEGEHATVASLAELYDHLQRCDPATDIVVVEDVDHRVTGYARVFWGDVHDHRTFFVAFEATSSAAGLLAELVAWGVRRSRNLASLPTHAEHPHRRIETWANEDGERQAVVEAAGFEASAWSAYLIRPHLGAVPDRRLPDGVVTRDVEPEHLRAIWEADVEAFRQDRDFVEQTEVDWERFLDEARDTSLWKIAWDDDGVVGQVRTYVNDGEAERLGRRRAWTENISTRADRRKQGIASALIAASLRQLAERGFDEAALGADLDSPSRALDLYESLGYEVVLRQAQYTLPI